MTNPFHNWNKGGTCTECGCSYAGFERRDPCPPGKSPSPVELSMGWRPVSCLKLRMMAAKLRKADPSDETAALMEEAAADIERMAQAPAEQHISAVSREEIARIIDPVSFHLTPQTYGTDEEGFKRTFAYGAQLVALERADAVTAALRPRESEVGIPDAPAELSVGAEPVGYGCFDRGILFATFFAKSSAEEEAKMHQDTEVHPVYRHPAPSEHVVAVKPLEWNGNSGRGVVASYRVGWNASGQSWGYGERGPGYYAELDQGLGTLISGPHDRRKEAEQSADKHYADRVRAALTATADTQNPLSSTNGEIGETTPADPATNYCKFALGDRVRKTKGSSWQGRIVGFYSTELTPIGYAVESEREPGSVQIYPETALANLEDQP